MANNYKAYKKAKKEKNLAEKGMVVGGTLSGLGGGTLLLREGIKKNLKKISEGEGPTIKTIEEASKKGKKVIDLPESITPEKLKKYKKTGVALATIGGITAGVSAYKHHKAKKKLNELEK